MRFSYMGRNFSIDGANPEDHIAKEIARTGTFYEIDLLEYIRELIYIRQRTTSIDVGANIGNHAIYLRSHVSEVVLAVEPNPAIVPVLRSNIGLTQGILVAEVALGAKEGSGQVLMPDGASGNIGMAQIRESDGPIQITTLDSLVSGMKIPAPVLLIKIDVEGMELDVLKGARVTLIEYEPHLLIEAASSERLQQLTDYLREFGYKSITRWAQTPVYHFACRPPWRYVVRARAFRAKFLAKKVFRQAFLRVFG